MSSTNSPDIHNKDNNDTTTSSKESSEEMPALRIDPSRASTLLSNIAQINSRISSTCKTHSIHKRPRLVAVSKLKPATDILALHQPPKDATSHNTSNESESQSLGPQVHFGENYVQELLEKSRLLPSSIKWHFIGGLQSNKCTQLARDVSSLWAVESVDSVKKAKALDKGRTERNEKLQQQSKSSDDNVSAENGHESLSAESLRVFVQVNTSGEDSKSGVEPQSTELIELCKTIREDCKALKLQGLMTIGAIARSKATTAETENEDFVALRECRDWVVKELSLGEEEGLELSMGMSEDFEGAIVQGSDEVRVGSTIFGERPPRKEAKVLEHTEEEKT